MRNLLFFSGLILLTFLPERSECAMTTAPPVMTGTVDTLVFCASDGNAVLPDTSAHAYCSAHIWKTLDVTDTCATALTYYVRIYPFDGTEEITSETFMVQLDSAHHAALNFDTRTSFSPDSAVFKNGLPYTAAHCDNIHSYHRMIWTILNDCDQTAEYEYVFRIEDCSPPKVFCGGLYSVVMPSSGLLTLHAKDFITDETVDECAMQNLQGSFSGEEYVPDLSFTCDYVMNNGPSYMAEIWVADGGSDRDCDGVIRWDERNKDYCSTLIVIDDNEHTCDSVGPHTGRITTLGGEGIPDVTVTAKINGQIDTQTTTDEHGYYDLEIPNPLFSIEVFPEKIDHPKNGVSTLDLVILRKYLLGLQPFDNPFLLIAADANNSESVSALDLVEIWKLILGLTTNFPNNKSWRFVPVTYNFPDPTDPWPFDEFIQITPLNMSANFYGIKVGDLNGTAIINATQVQTRGARNALSFNTADRDVSTSQDVTIPVYSDNFSDILGFQFTLETKGLQYTGVESGSVDLASESIAAYLNAISLSCVNLTSFGEAVSVDMSKPLFTLHFKATQSGILSEMLTISSRITEAEAYRNLAALPGSVGQASEGPASVDNNIETLTPELQFGTPKSGNDFALYQNLPNPFSDETVVGFSLPEAMPARITVFDLNGRVVFATEGDYGSGFHQVFLKAKDIGMNGVYYYRLEAGDFTASRKCIFIGG